MGGIYVRGSGAGALTPPALVLSDPVPPVRSWVKLVGAPMARRDLPGTGGGWARRRLNVDFTALRNDDVLLGPVSLLPADRKEGEESQRSVRGRRRLDRMERVSWTYKRSGHKEPEGAD